MSQQALSKARSKFDHKPFQKLFDGIRDAFYQKEYYANLNKYEGKILIGIDGSKTELPNLPALLEEFGGTGAKASSPTALITLVLQIGPEIYKAIDYLVKNGEIDIEQLKKTGLKALSASAEGFLRGSISASLTIACQAGKLGA